MGSEMCIRDRYIGYFDLYVVPQLKMLLLGGSIIIRGKHTLKGFRKKYYSGKMILIYEDAWSNKKLELSELLSTEKSLIGVI